MSDGPSDCAYAAEARATEFAKRRFPDLKVLGHPRRAYKGQRYILIYEEWLDHVVELVTSGRVSARWVLGPFKGTRRLHVSVSNEAPGYYREHRLERRRQ